MRQVECSREAECGRGRQAQGLGDVRGEDGKVGEAFIRMAEDSG